MDGMTVRESGAAEQQIHHEDPPLVDEDDPHHAALADNPEHPEKLSMSVLLSVFFLSLSFVGPISFGLVLPTSIISQIGTALGDLNHIVWIASGWTTGASTSFSLAGRLSDIFGRRYIIIAGNAVCVVGFIIGATAQTTKIVGAAGAVIGFGTGMVFVAYAGIPEMLPNKWRGAGLAFTELLPIVPWNFASVLIAYKFIQTATWRWCYYGGIIYSVVSTIGVAACYFPPSRPRRDYEKTRWDQVKELDFIGMSLYTGGLVTLLIGLSWAGTTGHPWKSASVIAPILVGVFVLAACLAYDFTIAKNPLFPLDLFRRGREFSVLLIIQFVGGMSYFSMSALLPQGTLYMFTNDPTEIGVMGLPNGAGQIIGGVILPALVHKMKYARVQIIVSLIFQTLFNGLYAYASPNHKGAWMAFQLFGQGCFGWMTICCYVIAGLHVPHRELGIATGLLGTFREGGGSVGNAIFSTILNSVASKKVAPQIAAAAVAAGFNPADLATLIPAAYNNAIGVPGAFAKVPGITPSIEAEVARAFKQAYGQAFRVVFYSTIPFNVLALVAACFIKDVSQYFTNHVTLHLEKDILGRQHDDHTLPKRKGESLALERRSREDAPSLSHNGALQENKEGHAAERHLEVAESKLKVNMRSGD